MRFVRLLAWLLVFVAQPVWAQGVPQLQSLEHRLAALATENPGEYGIAALDLTTGESVSFNGSRAFPMASTVKVAIAAVYLSQVDAGWRSLDDSIGGVSAGQLMDQMLVHSNNRSTDQLLAALGGPTVVDGWLRAHNLSGIRVDRTIAQLLSDRRDLSDIRDSSTPEAMLGLLRLIDTGNALRPQSRAVLMDMMRRCATGTNRIRGILPSDVMVEHKTGTLNGYTGDVGYLTLEDGRRLAVVFFARGGTNRPAVIATAARAIYDTFAGNDGRGLASPYVQSATRQASWRAVTPPPQYRSSAVGVAQPGPPATSTAPSGYRPLTCTPQTVMVPGSC